MGGALSSRLKGLSKLQKEQSIQGLSIGLDVDASKVKLCPAIHRRNPRVASNFMVYLAGKALQSDSSVHVTVHQPLPCELGLKVLSTCSSAAARNARHVYQTLDVGNRYLSESVTWRDMISEMWLMSALESTSKLETTNHVQHPSGKRLRTDVFVLGAAHHLVPKDSDYFELNEIAQFFTKEMMKLGNQPWKRVCMKPSYTLDSHTRPISADLLVNDEMLLDVRCSMTNPQARRKKVSDDRKKLPLTRAFEETALLRLLAMTILARRDGTVIKKVGFVLPYQQSFGYVELHNWDSTVLEKLLFPQSRE